MALIDAEHKEILGETEVKHRTLSEVPKLMMREKHLLARH